MAPNAKSETIVQIANPFDLPVYKLRGGSEEPSAVYHQGSSGHQELANDDDDEPAVRITTRARITYELDRFHKNEMLIICNPDIDSEKAMNMVTVFEKHKFEFTLIEPGREEENEVRQKIDQFFQKDFSNIGMTVVVTLLSSPDLQGSTTVNRVEEWDVLNYFMENQPATLQGRPKVFISEAPEPSNLPQVTELPNDTMLIQTKRVVHHLGATPLDLFCSKLSLLERTRDLLEIVSEFSSKASKIYANTSPFKCLHTMSKELLLEKIAETTTEENINRFMSNPNFFYIYLRLLCPHECSRINSSNVGELHKAVAKRIREAKGEPRAGSFLAHAIIGFFNNL